LALPIPRGGFTMFALERENLAPRFRTVWARPKMAEREGFEPFIRLEAKSLAFTDFVED
jgi:hypothetical protein